MSRCRRSCGSLTPSPFCRPVLDGLRSLRGRRRLEIPWATGLPVHCGRTVRETGPVTSRARGPWRSGQGRSCRPAMPMRTSITAEPGRGAPGDHLSLGSTLPPGPVPVQVMVQVSCGDPVKPPGPEQECRPQPGQLFAPGVGEWANPPADRRPDGAASPSAGAAAPFAGAAAPFAGAAAPFAGAAAPSAGAARPSLVQDSLVSKTVLGWNLEIPRPPDQAHDGVGERRERSARPTGFDCHVEHGEESGAGWRGRLPRGRVSAMCAACTRGGAGPGHPRGPGQEKDGCLGKQVSLAMGDPPPPRWRPRRNPDRLSLAGIRYQKLRHRENPVALPPEFLPVVVSHGGQ